MRGQPARLRRMATRHRIAAALVLAVRSRGVAGDSGWLSGSATVGAAGTALVTRLADERDLGLAGFSRE